MISVSYYPVINICIDCISNSTQDYLDEVTRLPEFDKPSYFGLPENIERSAQRIISNQVISQLKVLQRADVKASKFDKEVWANELGPVLNLWKKLNSVRWFRKCSLTYDVFWFELNGPCRYLDFNHFKMNQSKFFMLNVIKNVRRIGDLDAKKGHMYCPCGSFKQYIHV